MVYKFLIIDNYYSGFLEVRWLYFYKVFCIFYNRVVVLMDFVGIGYNCFIIKFYVGFFEIGEYNFL